MKTAKLTVDKLLKALADYNAKNSPQFGRKFSIQLFDDGSGHLTFKGDSRGEFMDIDECLKLLRAK